MTEVIEYTVRVTCEGAEWRLNGKHHREDGPAIERVNGYREWWLNGKPHREDGPAVEFANGHKEWWLNGKRHREDGPAIEYAHGNKEWYINGERLIKSAFDARTQVKELSVHEVQQLLGYKIKIVE